MALTYYIRSWDPRSTYPSNPQEGDICYTITLDQKWAPVGGVKKDNIIKEEVYQNGAWVEQGGGGGSLTVLYDGEITTIEDSGYVSGMAEISWTYSELPTEVTVVFEGETYTLPYVDGDGAGAPWVDDGFDWSEYPFCVVIMPYPDDGGLASVVLATEEPGTYSLTISANMGGGGSSDYSTCQVTFKNETGGGIFFGVPYLLNDALNGCIGMFSDGTEVHDVVLYKGKVDCLIVNRPEGSTVTTTGDCTWYNRDAILTITGDGSVTVSV